MYMADVSADNAVQVKMILDVMDLTPVANKIQSRLDGLINSEKTNSQMQPLNFKVKDVKHTIQLIEKELNKQGIRLDVKAKVAEVKKDVAAGAYDKMSQAEFGKTWVGGIFKSIFTQQRPIASPTGERDSLGNIKTVGFKSSIPLKNIH